MKPDHARKVLFSNQRHIAAQDNHVAVKVLNVAAAHKTACPVPSCCSWTTQLTSSSAIGLANRVSAVADDDRDSTRAEPARTCQNMQQQRLAAHRMKHLWQADFIRVP